MCSFPKTRLEIFRICLLLQMVWVVINAGDYASSHAVTSMVEEIRQDADFNPVKVIRHAIECVNTEILTQAQQDEKLRGMGTTIVAATIVGHYAYVANVGDSRLYVIGEKIQQITRDHSLVQEMVKNGRT